MTIGRATPRPGKLSILMIVTSLVASIGISVAMDAVGLRLITFAPVQIIVAAALFNATCVLQSLVGGIIEWRRPGHTIGRLLMLSGPGYGFVSAGWTTAGTLQSFVDPQLYLVASWAVFMLSYPVIALMAGWVPLLFPTGRLPSPRWRIPIASLIVLSTIGLAAMAVRPGPLAAETGLRNPFGIDGWPAFLQTFVDAIPLELVVLLGLGAAAVITRYRRGDRVERLQIRWFASAASVCTIGFAATVVAFTVRSDGPPIAQSTTLVGYAGILLMPIAIGIAVLRYRLYEIDRIISRTIGWAIVTGLLLGLFAASVVGLQAILADVNQGQTLAVAASTLVAFVLFQPVRRRVQSIVDRRFNRARYDAEGTAAAFAERQRDQVDIAGLTVDLTGTINSALHPRALGVWIRRSGSGGTP
jgi:hypothetical protein